MVFTNVYIAYIVCKQCREAHSYKVFNTKKSLMNMKKKENEPELKVLRVPGIASTSREYQSLSKFSEI